MKYEFRDKLKLCESRNEDPLANVRHHDRLDCSADIKRRHNAMNPKLNLPKQKKMAPRK